MTIFAEFFKTPLFNQDGVDRELNAIDSEYKKNLSNEMRREMQILKSDLCSKDSPIKGFGTGNKETLNIPFVRELMLKYY